MSVNIYEPWCHDAPLCINYDWSICPTQMTNGGNFITFNPYVRLKRWFPGPVNNFPVNYQQVKNL
jgi:hypothetical protein